MEPTPNEQPTSDMPAPGGERGTTDRFRELLRTPSDGTVGQQIGPYRLVSLIGEGGFGEVWVAERREPFVQRVALKVIKAGMDSKSVVARFEQERQALAVMNHPNIAKVLDGGLTPRGRPYFAMEFVKGEPITEFCDARKLTVKQRLELFAQACEAIQHAHLKGIVHRDIKPSNILAFAVEGAAPRLKVIDFGVAKAMSQPLTDKTIFTETGQMIGTPAYMSPEQADPSAGDIDTRSDIYSLGVLLYELVTGATPFDAKTLRAKAYGEIQRIIREDDPPTPSARLSTISTKDAELASRIEKARGIALRDLTRELKSELEWIPLKAMRKEPEGRYQTAIALADDVRAYLDGQPITAAPESTGYRIRKYVRRHRGPVLAAMLIGGALLAGIAGTTWKWREAEAAKLEAVAARDSADASAAAERSAREAGEAALKRLNTFVASSASDNALRAAQTGRYEQLRTELKTLEDIGQGNRFDARLALALSDQSSMVLLRGTAAADIAYISFGRDGRSIMSLSDDGKFRAWDHATGSLIREFSVASGRFLAFDGVGELLVDTTNEVGQRASLQLWDVVAGRLVGEFRGEDGHVGLARFSSDGSILATVGGAGAGFGTSDTTVRLWNVKARCAIGVLAVGDERHIRTLAFSPDGRTLATGDSDGTIRLWDVGTTKARGAPWLAKGSDEVIDIAFSPDGRLLASATEDGKVRLWETDTGRAVREAFGECSFMSFFRSRIVFSPDSNRLATSDLDGPIRLWDISSGTQIGSSLRGHQSSWCIAFSPDGEFLASAGHRDGEGELRLWDLSQCLPEDVAKRAGDEDSVEISHVAVSPDGNVIARCGHSWSWGGFVDLWDTRSGRPLGLPMYRSGDKALAEGGDVVFSPDGRVLASTGLDGAICLWDVSSGHLAEIPSPFGFWSAASSSAALGFAFSQDGRFLTIAHEDGTVGLWDVATGDPVFGCTASGAPCQAVAFSPDGRTIATAAREGPIELRDTASGSVLGFVDTDEISSIAFSADGKRLAIGTNSLIRIWDFAIGDYASDPLPVQEPVASLAFSPDGKLLASGEQDLGRGGRLRLWDTSTWRAVGEPLLEGKGDVRTVLFSKDGTMLLSCGYSPESLHRWYPIPMHERASAVRPLQAQVESVRAELELDLARIGHSWRELEAFDRRVRSDARYAGSLRTASLIVIGEASRRQRKASHSYLGRVYDSQEDLERVLSLLAEAEPRDLEALDEKVLSRAAWRGLTELRPDSPLRDLERLSIYAKSGAREWDKGYPSSDRLNTLARAHWESGRKANAVSVQLEAVAARTRDSLRDLDRISLAELQSTLEKYEREDPPRPPTATRE